MTATSPTVSTSSSGTTVKTIFPGSVSRSTCAMTVIGPALRAGGRAEAKAPASTERA